LQATAKLEIAEFAVSSDIKESASNVNALKGLPCGWSFQSRQLTVATPQGDSLREITFYQNSLGMEFVKILLGSFMMGDTLSPQEVHSKWPGGQLEWYKRSHPRRRVQLTQGFYIASAPVTRGQFAHFVHQTGYKTDAEKQGRARAFKDGKWDWQDGVDWKNPLFDQTNAHPVVCVSYNDAIAFCQWLSQKEGQTYTLPTEAQWEYAARAGADSTTWYWGDDESGAQGRANTADEGNNLRYAFEGVKDGYEFTSPIASFTPNAFGLHDTIGNVWEWCLDWFQDSYSGLDTIDPEGPPSGSLRVLRGGSWSTNPRLCRAAFRYRYAPDSRRTSYGFRVVVVFSETRNNSVKHSTVLDCPACLH